MDFRAFAETRRRTERPSVSDISVTLHRFGRKRRLVLRLEWLTLWPVCAVLPVNSQRRDIGLNSVSAEPRVGVAPLFLGPEPEIRLGGSRSAETRKARKDRGRIANVRTDRPAKRRLRY